MIKVMELSERAVNDDFVIDDKGRLIEYTGNSKDITIPDKVEKINAGPSYFRGEGDLGNLVNVEVIRFTKSSKIRDFRIQESESLKEIHVPDNIYLDNFVLRDCTNISGEITLPCSRNYNIQWIGKISNLIVPKFSGEVDDVSISIDYINEISLPDYDDLQEEFIMFAIGKGLYRDSNIKCKSEKVASRIISRASEFLKTVSHEKEGNISINGKSYKITGYTEQDRNNYNDDSENIEEIDWDFDLRVYKSDFSDHILYVRRDGYDEFFTDLSLSNLRKLGLKFDRSSLLLKGNNSLITLKDLNSPEYLEGEPGDYTYELQKYLSGIVKEYFNKPAGRIYYFSSDSCYEDTEDLGLYDGEPII